MHDIEPTEQRDEIAIIGMAGRFPGAKNIDEYWQNLCDGVESVRSFSSEEIAASGVDPGLLVEPLYVNAVAFLEEADAFDAAFFGYSPREAQLMDPQQRIFLECAATALEHAGHNPETFDGLIGVFGGVAQNTYLLHNVAVYLDLIRSGAPYVAMLGSEKDFPATRVSYKLDLRGPSLNVQTACSTSGVAVHLACQSLLTYESDMALVGGARVRVPLKAGYLYVDGGILSPDGHCRAFDEKARGTIQGSGVGFLVLRRLADALLDGDTIYAVIKGSAINNDGAAKVGYTAPSVEGQAAVIQAALVMADVDADTIGYVETHGTGTQLGDPIEIAALTKAFRKYTDRVGICPIGSVKTNIGHLDAGAAAAGIIKTVLALKHGLLPPSLNFERPNPQIDFANGPFYVNTELSAWPAGRTPRRAGVSSFGLGGTNAHIILEEAPTVEPSGATRPYQLLLFSAKNGDSLERATSNMGAHLLTNPDLNLADTAYTMQVGRQAFHHRRALVCQDLDQAAAALVPGFTGVRPKVWTGSQPAGERSIAFMFTGQGAQYVNMAQELYMVESTFREHVDLCCDLLRPHLRFDLRSVLFPGEGVDLEAAAEQLKQTAVTQPALFVIEYALARLWQQWGIEPHAMVGHSIGEYVAACLAGVFSLENALALVASRGRLMQELPGGSMLVVPLSENEIRPSLNNGLSLAAINAPALCVVSGENKAVEEMEELLKQRNVHCRRLHTSHAFHSKMMEPILDTFTAQVGQVRLNAPRIPFVSNVTGTWIKPQEVMDPGYWARHIRQTVRFSDCVQTLLTVPYTILLETGPGNTLSALARQQLDTTKEQMVLSSLRHPQEKRSDVAFILNTVGRLWLAGVQIDWPSFYAQERRHRVPLPTYPFARKRHWLNAGSRRYAAASRAPRSSEGLGQAPLSNRADSEQTNDDTCDDAPRSRVEQSIANIWQEFLGIERVSIHDNFFELGGNSLLATQVISGLRDVFGVRLSIASFFETPSIAELAVAVEEARRGAADGPADQSEDGNLDQSLRLLGIA